MPTNVSPNFPASDAERSPDVIEVDVLADVDALAAIEEDWSRLWSSDLRSTPFQSPAWLLPWWRHVGQGELLTFAARGRSSGALVGLLPAYVYRDVSGTRQLFPIGIATTDYLDVLAAPDCARAVTRAIFDRVSTLADRWDVAEFPQLRADSPLTSKRFADHVARRGERGRAEPGIAARWPIARHAVIAIDGRKRAVLPASARAERRRDVRTRRRRRDRSGDWRARPAAHLAVGQPRLAWRAGRCERHRLAPRDDAATARSRPPATADAAIRRRADRRALRAR